MKYKMYLPDPPTEIRLDLTIQEVDRVIEDTFQLFHAEIPRLTEFGISVIVESMLPHKQIIKDRLADMDTQFRMDHYGFC